MLASALACAVVGSPKTVRAGLAAFAERTGADELIVTGSIFDHEKRVRSFEIAAQAMA
jgi:alkanesulfonate monooxygenase SsuD/methylene tetrahydromethanopterin reductase-like flavin-dependent oxidoreductase (luciferase family)